jgi:hypothetical protein
VIEDSLKLDIDRDRIGGIVGVKIGTETTPSSSASIGSGGQHRLRRVPLLGRLALEHTPPWTNQSFYYVLTADKYVCARVVQRTKTICYFKYFLQAISRYLS